MRRAVAGACGLALLLVACGGGDDGATPATTATSRTPATTQLAPTNEATPETDATATGELVEVTGIVGGVDPAAGMIEINWLAGAQVSRVRVDAATQIRTSTGTPLQLSGIRVSDRIIASGVVDAAGDVLAAREIRVGGVLGGAEGG
jgi:hypothetical protein